MLQSRNLNRRMEAVNHLKNSAMEADTILKHGASLKSQTSKGNNLTSENGAGFRRIRMKTFKTTSVIFLFVVLCFHVNAQNWQSGNNAVILNPTTANVGIGTTTPNPQAKLDVAGTILTEKLLVNKPNRITNWNDVWQSGFFDAENASNAPASGWIWGINMNHGANSPTYRYGGQIAILNSNTSPTMFFRSTNANGEGTWARVLTSVGGQQINGSLSLNSGSLSLSNGNISIEGSGDAGSCISIRNNSKTQNGTANFWRIYNVTGSYGNSLQFWAYDNLGCNGGGLCAARLILMDNGNVGIGTNNPTQRLHVAGNIRAEGTVRANEFRVTAGGADFVFDADYYLRPLSEVEQFIIENKHLPEIAPANSMIQDGVSIGELQMQLLQKIEELTLYVIELKKEIDELKK